MNNYFKHTLSNGMQLFFIEKNGYIKSYAGIGTKFGGSDLEYIEDGINHKLKPGIAHFLEHKLFAQKNGKDAMEEFMELNSIANAYTTSDKTIYYFTTNDDLKKPLALLLNMYFNPFFTFENIEKEKDIIISELNMNLDDISFLYTNYIINTLYPNDSYSKLILGDENDIKSINKYDLYEAYNAFYTPENSVLCIVSDIKKEDLINFLEEEIKKYNFIDNKIVKLNSIKSQMPKDELSYFIDNKINQTELTINLRMDDITNRDAISCEMISCILNNILNISSKLYKKLDKKNLLLNDIEYNTITSKETSYVIISISTNKPLKVNKIIKKELKNINELKLKKELIDIYFKRLKSKYIQEEDKLSSLGDKILSLALEDIDYEELNNLLLNIKEEDIYKYINSIKNAKISSIISKNEKN